MMLHLLLRAADDDYEALGLVIKIGGDHLTWSERNDRWRSFRIGPLFVRTYHRKTIS